MATSSQGMVNATKRVLRAFPNPKEGDLIKPADFQGTISVPEIRNYMEEAAKRGWVVGEPAQSGVGEDYRWTKTGVEVATSKP